MNWETILCLGDSITIGSRCYLGYPEYCGNFLNNKTHKHWNVMNHAVSGFTTIDLVRHMDSNWSNLKDLNPEAISIMIGTNDLKSKTTIADFDIAYRQLIIKSRLLVNSNNIIIHKIPLLQSGVMLPYNLKMNDIINDYNNTIIQIAESEELILNDMDSYPEYYYDGVHLNSKGSKAWGKILSEIILGLRNG